MKAIAYSNLRAIQLRPIRDKVASTGKTFARNNNYVGRAAFSCKSTCTSFGSVNHGDYCTWNSNEGKGETKAKMGMSDTLQVLPATFWRRE